MKRRLPIGIQDKEYILKHKNIDVLLFDMNNEDYTITDIKKIYDYNRLPFNLENRVNNIECASRLGTWIKSRGLSGSRKDIPEIKRIFNTDNIHKLTVDSYGLNLTDHYWFHKTDNDLKWEKFNYFDNEFDQLKQSGNYSPVIDNSVNNTSPNFCVDGSIVKRWVVNNGDRMLLKGSRYKNMQEPYNERIVSLILDEFKLDHVQYNQKSTKDMIPYSECKTMSDRNIEFINAQWVINSEEYKDKTISLYSHYINLCQKNNILFAKENVDAMLALDFLIGNEDRHKGNFGILRNADTLEWKIIAPIFDNGNSLFFDRDDNSINEWGIDSLGKAFDDGNRLQLNLIGYPEWYDNIKGKRITEIIVNGLKCNERLSDERINKISEIYNERRNIFEKTINKKHEEPC
jgi:hypothetical protein